MSFLPPLHFYFYLFSEKLTVLSIAPALAEAMRRIHNGESVSALF